MSRLTIILFSKILHWIVFNIFIKSLFQPKKDVSVAAPIMHPIFGASDPNQVPPATNNIMNPLMPGQNQYDQSYGTVQPPMQPTAAPMNVMNPTNFYQPQQQQQQQMPDNSNMINYQNFNSFAGGQQQQQQQEMPVQPPPVQQVVKEKPPLPEEFIYLQTVLEELKTQCINRATNPVSLELVFFCHIEVV